MNYTNVARGLAIVWTIIMLIGCLTPHAEIPGPIVTFNDKLMHVAIFVPFSLLWIVAGFRRNGVIIAGFFLGALIELLQYVLPINRSAEWVDFFADCVGTILGVMAAGAWFRFFQNRNT